VITRYQSTTKTCREQQYLKCDVLKGHMDHIQAHANTTGGLFAYIIFVCTVGLPHLAMHTLSARQLHFCICISVAHELC